MSVPFLATACPIAMMTFTSRDLEAVQARYEEHLSYELRSSGVVSTELAESWGAPKISGRPHLGQARTAIDGRQPFAVLLAN